MVEGEAAGEGEAPVWSGNEGARGHGDEGGAGVAGLDFEAMPESGGDLPEFAFGDEVEIEKDEGEVSIAEEEVGALEGLLGFGTAEPDEVAAFFVAVGGGVEGIAAIDEGEREVALFVEEFGDNEGGSGGVVGGDDFAEVAGMPRGGGHDERPGTSREAGGGVGRFGERSMNVHWNSF
ncbi:MAG: hypothetical protein ACJAQT_004073 [Akkermansiaceae bacterium]|jgi:hypothetical protein